MEEEKIHQDTEDRLIDYINFNAGGRLIAFKPTGEEAKGADLIVKKKGEYELIPEDSQTKEAKVIKTRAFGVRKPRRVKEIFLRVFVRAKKEREDVLKVEVDISDLEKREDFYLVFAIFDIIKQDIEEDVYIFSLEQFKENAQQIRENVFRVEIPFSKENQHKDFLINKRKLSKFFLNLLFS